MSSNSIRKEKEETLQKSLRMIYNKLQQQEFEYYSVLGESIKYYVEELLFVSATPNVELLNILEADLSFSKIKIEIRQANKMTENREHAIVREYFSNSGLVF